MAAHGQQKPRGRSPEAQWAADEGHQGTKRANDHPKVVSKRLGHATVSITLDTYSHAILAMQEEAAVKIAGLVFAGK